MEVKVYTKGRRGKLTKTVRVMSDDPSNPQAKLVISADIDAPPMEPAKAVQKTKPMIKSNPKFAQPKLRKDLILNKAQSPKK